MKYDQEIEREIELEADDFVALFRAQEAVDGGTRVYISNIEFLRAIGRLDPVHQMSDERREELREQGPDPTVIHSEEMERDIPEEEAEESWERLLHGLSISGEYTVEQVREYNGDWAVERLHEDDRVTYHEMYDSFAWNGDQIYER